MVSKPSWTIQLAVSRHSAVACPRAGNSKGVPRAWLALVLLVVTIDYGLSMAVVVLAVLA